MTLDLFGTPADEDVAGAAGDVAIDHGFPEESADALARIEAYNKHLYRPNTYLHKWWARRSGSTFRYILKQLVPDPRKRDYYLPGGLEGKVILDPMMGGGTTLHEAIRMGASVIGVDIDPIPVVQAQATLRLAPLARQNEVFKRFIGTLSRELSPLYETKCGVCGDAAETQFVLYGLVRACGCGEAILVNGLVLRQNHGADVQICPRCHEVYEGTEHECKDVAARPLVEKGTGVCAECGSEYRDLVDLPFPERYVPLVVVGSCAQHGQFFKRVAREDLAQIERARELAAAVDFGDPAAFRVPDGPKSGDLLRQGVTSFQELFTARQLLYLDAARRFLQGLDREDRLWLVLLVSTSLEFNSLLCGYKGGDIRRPGAIRHVFSHHAYSFPYTALENNPVFSDARSGTLRRLFNDRIRRASRWAMEPIERRIVDGDVTQVKIRGEVDGGVEVDDWAALAERDRGFRVVQADSAAIEIPEGTVDYVVTDPPYYDSVQYSDLSHFFRVWLRVFMPAEADWRYDPLGSAVSEGDDGGSRKYGEVLAGIWTTCRVALKRERGRLIFTFHHWSPEAWAELTLSLRKAGFRLVNRYVVSSENPKSVHIRNLKAIAHDTILVLRPVGGDDIDDERWEAVTEIDGEESEAFCRGCGSALGWLLSSGWSEERIREEWQRLLGRR